MEKKTFLDWYKEQEEKHGSLVTPASAAKMIGVTRQYIDKIVAAGRLHKLYYNEDESPLIGMKEIEAEIERRKEREIQKNKPGTLLLKAKVEELEEKLQKLMQEGQRDPVQEELQEEEWLNYKIEDLERKIEEETKRQRKAQEAISENFLEHWGISPKATDKN